MESFLWRVVFVIVVAPFAFWLADKLSEPKERG